MAFVVEFLIEILMWIESVFFFWEGFFGGNLLVLNPFLDYLRKLLPFFLIMRKFYLFSHEVRKKDMSLRIASGSPTTVTLTKYRVISSLHSPHW